MSIRSTVRRAGVAFVVLVVAVTGCSQGANRPAPAPPGTLIAAEPIDAPPGTRAWRITYHSRSLDDRDIVVSGMAVAPAADAAEPRPVVSWGHSTTGTADACAPSTIGASDLPVAPDVIAEGWTVVATDYEGLGSEGPHPYLVGASEGRSMLDAVRAASQIDGAGVQGESPVVLWGFSQGGHAALFAAQQASSYAPELDIVGIAAVAPVGSARQFWDRAVSREDQVGVAATMAYALAGADPRLALDRVLTDDAIDQLDIMESACIGEVVEAYTGPTDAVVRRSPDDSPEWAAALDENDAGLDSPGVPTLVMQGADDDIVYPEVAEALVERLCQFDQPVQYTVKPDAPHGGIAPGEVVPWLRARVSGMPAPTSCPD